MIDINDTTVREIDIYEQSKNTDPKVKEFYEMLKTIKNKENVQDVFIEVSDYAEDYWPLSERIYILTSATLEEVSEWVKHLEINTIVEGKTKVVPQIYKSLIAGYKIYCVWWNNDSET